MGLSSGATHIVYGLIHHTCMEQKSFVLEAGGEKGDFVTNPPVNTKQCQQRTVPSSHSASYQDMCFFFTSTACISVFSPVQFSASYGT